MLTFFLFPLSSTNHNLFWIPFIKDITNIMYDTEHLWNCMQNIVALYSSIKKLYYILNFICMLKY